VEDRFVKAIPIVPNPRCGRLDHPKAPVADAERCPKGPLADLQGQHLGIGGVAALGGRGLPDYRPSSRMGVI